MRAADVMTTEVCAASPEAPIHEIAHEMWERRISAVPVIDDEDRVLGVVSEGDLVRRAELGTTSPSLSASPRSTTRARCSTSAKTRT